MKSKIIKIEFWRIDPPHSPRDQNKVKKLEKSLKKGWVVRPLLVEQLERFGGLPQRYAAWTGSHRIKAAERLELENVPCFIITLEEAKKAIKCGYNQKTGYHSFKAAISGHDGPGDRCKYDALKKVGLLDAAEIMRAEIIDNEKEK